MKISLLSYASSNGTAIPRSHCERILTPGRSWDTSSVSSGSAESFSARACNPLSWVICSSIDPVSGSGDNGSATSAVLFRETLLADRDGADSWLASSL